MKIVITHAYYLSEDKNEQKLMLPYPPLGMLYVSAYLTEQGLANQVFDSTFSSEELLTEHLLTEKPDFICIYTNMITKPNVIRLMAFINSTSRLKDCRIILGGPDIRYNAEKYLLHGAHYLVTGEGEETTFELIQALVGGRPVNTISGIAFRESSGEIITTTERVLLDINKIPYPARQHIDIGKYLNTWKANHGYNSINISTMRGCPFGCRWCSKAVFGNTHRRRHAKLVVDEIEWIQRQYQVDKFWFVDDVFTLQSNWLTDFAVELSKRNRVISYECMTRADQLSDHDLVLLRQTGCYRVWIGGESGSQKILDRMNRKVTVGELQKAITSVKKSGIQAGTYIMLGYPGEDRSDIKGSLNLLKRADPDLFTITLTYPIKGTALYDEVELTDLQTNNWAVTTDRQTGFKRLYSRKYYEHALRYIQCEIAWAKARKTGNLFVGVKHKLRALYANLMMKQIEMF